MDQNFVVELRIGTLRTIIVFRKIRVAEVGKHVGKSLIEMLVGLAEVRMGIPPLRSLPFRVIIERLLSEEFIVFLVEPDKPANEDFSFISGTDLVDMLG